MSDEMAEADQTEPSTGYNGASVAIHWISATVLTGLWLTADSAPDSGGAFFHIALGSLIAIFLIYRVIRRALRGHAPKPEQAAPLNWLAESVRWTILATIAWLALSGLFLPWANGTAINLAGMASLPSPIESTPDFFLFLKTTHTWASNILVAAVILHMAGVTKHGFNNRDRIMERMLGPVRGGR